jgi:hypothetical protein
MGHYRVAMGCPGLGQLITPACHDLEAAALGRFAAQYCAPEFPFFVFFYIFKNSYKLLKYVENTIKLGKI